MNQIRKDEQAARLRQARLAGKSFSSAALAADAMGIPKPTYQAHENGNRGFDSEAPRYADFYRVNLEWLLTGRGSMKRGDFVEGLPKNALAHGTEKSIDSYIEPLSSQTINVKSWSRDLPILGSGACGEDGLFELNGQTHGFERRPPRLVGVKDAYALWVMGNSMFPWRRNGQIVIVHPHQPINVGDYVVVQLKPESHGALQGAYIKELVRRTAKELRLRQYSPDEEITIPMSKVASIHRIPDWDELVLG